MMTDPLTHPSAVKDLTDSAYWLLILGADSKEAARMQMGELFSGLRQLFRDCFDEDLVLGGMA